MDFEALRTELRRLMRLHDVPGVVLGVLWNGRTHTIYEGAIMSPPETNKMEFLRRPDGTIGWLRYGIFTVYTKRA
jgi:hypothetical protein